MAGRTKIWGALLALVGLLGALGSSAQAQGPRNDPPNDVAADHRRIVEFWTPERRAAAIPREMVRPSPNAKPGGAGKPGGGGGGDSTTVRGATWTQPDAPVVKTTGKVFFEMGGLLYTCSASAVDSVHGSLVLTAGHCVHDKTDRWATYFAFYPAYNGAESPTLGVWTATSLYTTSTWAESGDWDDDAGFAVVRNPGFGTTLEAHLAAYGVPSVPQIRFETSLDTHHAFGYPAAKKYSGKTLTYCAGPLRDDIDSNETVAMACDMTGGSSGGPWFGSFTTGTPVIHSVTSYGYASLRNVLFGPIFDGEEQTTYNAVAGASPSCSASSQTCTLVGSN